MSDVDGADCWPEQEIVYKWLESIGIDLLHRDVLPVLNELTALRTAQPQQVAGADLDLVERDLIHLRKHGHVTRTDESLAALRRIRAALGGGESD